MDPSEISKANLGKSEYIYFELFEIWVSNFSLKEKTMRNIHNQNMAELAQYIIVFYTQGFINILQEFWSHRFSTYSQVGNQGTLLFCVA